MYYDYTGRLSVIRCAHLLSPQWPLTHGGGMAHAARPTGCGKGDKTASTCWVFPPSNAFGQHNTAERNYCFTGYMINYLVKTKYCKYYSKWFGQTYTIICQLLWPSIYYFTTTDGSIIIIMKTQQRWTVRSSGDWLLIYCGCINTFYHVQYLRSPRPSYPSGIGALPEKVLLLLLLWTNISCWCRPFSRRLQWARRWRPRREDCRTESPRLNSILAGALCDIAALPSQRARCLSFVMLPTTTCIIMIHRVKCRLDCLSNEQKLGSQLATLESSSSHTLFH